MKNGRFSEPQVMGILKQAQSGVRVSELCPEHGMSMQNESLKEALGKRRQGSQYYCRSAKARVRSSSRGLNRKSWMRQRTPVQEHSCPRLPAHPFWRNPTFLRPDNNKNTSRNIQCLTFPSLSPP